MNPAKSQPSTDVLLEQGMVIIAIPIWNGQGHSAPVVECLELTQYHWPL